jgi:transposase-like protein
LNLPLLKKLIKECQSPFRKKKRSAVSNTENEISSNGKRRKYHKKNAFRNVIMARITITAIADYYDS